MGCNCGKNRAAPVGTEAKRTQAQAAADRAAKEAEARAANPSITRIGKARATSQTFSLQMTDGSVRAFGSPLERDAYAARNAS